MKVIAHAVGKQGLPRLWRLNCAHLLYIYSTTVNEFALPLKWLTSIWRPLNWIMNRHCRDFWNAALLFWDTKKLLLCLRTVLSYDMCSWCVQSVQHECTMSNWGLLPGSPVTYAEFCATVSASGQPLFGEIADLGCWITTWLWVYLKRKFCLLVCFLLKPYIITIFTFPGLPGACVNVRLGDD